MSLGSKPAGLATVSSSSSSTAMTFSVCQLFQFVEVKVRYELQS